jgi:hypothetical protein
VSHTGIHNGIKAIAAQARRGQDWEFDEVVWVALTHILTFFFNSGYLNTSETLLEFPSHADIPPSLLAMAPWRSDLDSAPENG